MPLPSAPPTSFLGSGGRGGTQLPFKLAVYILAALARYSGGIEDTYATFHHRARR